jgi:hypothetical protein
MPFNQWLIAVGLTVPFGFAGHLLSWQATYDAKPKWVFRAIAVPLLIFWFCNFAFAVNTEVRRNCTTILHCGLRK